jgi:hypothetical protein
MFNYRAFTDGDFAGNGAFLRDGVVGVECTEVRGATAGEVRDYLQFCPWGTHFGGVEVYANGARNMFVRNDAEKVIGVFRTRTLDTGLNL